MKKFQCSHCGGILMSSYEDEIVICGHCENQCEVPTEIGFGLVIDDFLIQDLLGSGGMGNVYVAYQFSLDRQVALKILHSEFVENPKFQEDFIREARSVASLNHVNIIQAYKVGVEEGILYFAMELVEGLDLSSVLKREGSIIELYGIDIALDTTNALGYAWERSRLVHRDIKPENIMVASDGTCKVMDLGLSQRAGDNYDDEDQISGTPQYISPEQVLGTEIDIRTDFYCLGATLFHLTAGRFVFEADTLPEMVQMHVNVPAPSLKEFAPHTSDEFCRIVAKLLEKNPDQRYQSSDELITDLENLKNNTKGKTQSRKQIHINPKRIKRNSKKLSSDVKEAKQNKSPNNTLLMLSVVVILIIAFAAGIITIFSDNSQQEVPVIQSKIQESSPSVPDTNEKVADNATEGIKAQISKSVEDNEKKLAETKNSQSQATESKANEKIIEENVFVEKDGVIQFAAGNYYRSFEYGSKIKWNIAEKRKNAKSHIKTEPQAGNKPALKYKFQVNNPGDYDFFINIKSPTQQCPILVRYNSQPINAEIKDLKFEKKFKVVKLPVKLKLTKGNNTLQISTKYNSVVINHIFLSKAKDWSPQTKNFKESAKIPAKK